jgi:superoxide dismutase, Fe-Mn family
MAAPASSLTATGQSSVSGTGAVYLGKTSRVEKKENTMTAPFALAPLPWPENALEPAISAKTIQFHYHKHHRKYVDELNKLVEGTRFASMPLEEIVRATYASKDDKEKKIFNNAAQAWNHDFFWKSLTPKTGKPAGELKNAIERDFGSVDALIKKLADEGKAQFGSGWVWLTSTEGKLAVEKTANAVDPMAKDSNCLLTVDVWEHAYYLDYQNDRAKFLETVLSKLMNWDFAAENFANEQAYANRAKVKGFEQAKQDVSKAFKRPQDVAEAKNLTPVQKIELLKQWEMDLRQLMVASEENMPGTAPGQTAETMRNVRVLLTKLGAGDHEPAAVNKAGG